MKAKHTKFKTKQDKIRHLKEHMLTAGKLIEWLKQFPEDTLIYRIESNTGDWQEMPAFDSRLQQFFKSMKDERKEELEYLKSWFRSTKDKNKRIKEEYKRIFQYVNKNDGIAIRC